MTKREALDAIATYFDAKRTADSYPTDQGTERHLATLADQAIEAFAALAN